MIYGKFILRIEDKDDIYLFHTDEELVENANILFTEFGIKERAKDINELKSILDNNCEGVHLYVKAAG